MRRHVVLVSLLALAACRGGDGPLRANGTIEVVEVDVASMVPARVVRVMVEEGDAVRAGDTVALLSLTTLPSDIEARQARVAAAQAALRDLSAGARPAEIAQAEEQVRAAVAESTRAARDLVRMSDLTARQVVSQQQLDAARAAETGSASRAAAAREALRLLREGARPERVRAAEAELANARAGLAGARATAADLVLTSPVAGRILARHVEPGEVIPAGVAAVTVGETARPWVRVYVPAHSLPGIAVGSRARVTVPGHDGTAWSGRVTAINDRAEFTPRVALTEEEREDLLFGVKVEVSDSTGALKPGLPAVVELEAGGERSRVGVEAPSGDSARAAPHR